MENNKPNITSINDIINDSLNNYFSNTSTASSIADFKTEVEKVKEYTEKSISDLKKLGIGAVGEIGEEQKSQAEQLREAMIEAYQEVSKYNLTENLKNLEITRCQNQAE